MVDELKPEIWAYDANGVCQRLNIGDCFYYRGKDSPSAAVTSVIVRSFEPAERHGFEGVVGLALIDTYEGGYEDAREAPQLFVEAKKIVVVNIRGPLRKPPLEPPAPPPLPKQMLRDLKKRRK